MVYSFIGLIVGLVMGLTGAGGALISIPLFLALLNASLKEVTVLSLIAVILGTLFNLFGQKHPFDKKIVISFILFGTISNYASLPLKASLPDIVIAILLTIIAIFSVWSIWAKKTFKQAAHEKNQYVKLISTGLFLGLITTMTGLGGGVLLVPILIQGFGKTYEEALPTSLATILMVSFISFLFQINVATEMISFMEIALIALGALSAYFFLKILVKKFNSSQLEKPRKIVFSMVVIYAVITILIKSF